MATTAQEEKAARERGHDPSDGNGHGNPEDVGPPPIVIDGTGQLGFDVGGKKPTSSTLTITGGKFEVDGSFRKGDTLVLRLEDADGNSLARVPLLVDSITFKDKVDAKTGQVVDCARQHKARVQAS